MLKKFNNSFAGIFFIIVGIIVAIQIPSIRVMKVAMDSKLLPEICVALLIVFGVSLLIQDLIFGRDNRRREKVSFGMAFPATERLSEEQDKAEGTGVEKENEIKSEKTNILVFSEKQLGIIRVTLCIVFLANFILLLRPVGFIAAGILYLLTTFFVLTPKEKWKSVTFYILGIVVPIVVYVLFVYAFKVLLPIGTIWWV
jgi:hypothetical protein